MSIPAPTVQEIKEAWDHTNMSYGDTRVTQTMPEQQRRKDADEDFIANLPAYIPALLKAASRRPLTWVERPTVSGLYWMRRLGLKDQTVNYDKENYPRMIIFDRGEWKYLNDFPDACFQGPIAPDKGGEER